MPAGVGDHLLGAEGADRNCDQIFMNLHFPTFTIGNPDLVPARNLAFFGAIGVFFENTYIVGPENPLRFVSTHVFFRFWVELRLLHLRLLPSYSLPASRLQRLTARAAEIPRG